MADIKQSKSVWWRIKRIGIGIGLVFYLYPLYCLALNQWPGWDLGKLYTFGLDLKDFMTAWIALGGVVAVVIGIFQTQRRITKQEEQFKKQTELQQKQQRDARFASGVELLGNPHESTRIGGAYNLYFLARDYPEYRTPVCEILCAHLRTVTRHKEYQGLYKARASNEVQTVIDLLFKKKEDGISIFFDIVKILDNTFLCGIKVVGYRMNKVSFTSAQLSGVKFYATKLSRIDFFGAKLDEVGFNSADLNRCSFYTSEICNADFDFAQMSIVDFHLALLRDANFKETCLESYEYEEIVKKGRSLELTGADKKVWEHPMFDPLAD